MLFRSPKPQTPNPKPQTPNPFVSVLRTVIGCWLGEGQLLINIRIGCLDGKEGDAMEDGKVIVGQPDERGHRGREMSAEKVQRKGAGVQGGVGNNSGQQGRATGHGGSGARLVGHLYERSFTKHLAIPEIVKDIIFNVIAAELHHQFCPTTNQPVPLTEHEERVKKLGLLSVDKIYSSLDETTSPKDLMLNRLQAFRQRTLRRLVKEVLAIKEEVQQQETIHNEQSQARTGKSKGRFGTRKTKSRRPKDDTASYALEIAKAEPKVL